MEESLQRFLDGFGSHYITQDLRWPRVKGAAWTPHRLAATDPDGKIAGFMQMLSIHDARTGSHFFYIPRGPVCDPTNTELLDALVDAGVATAKEAGADRMLIDPMWHDSADARERLERLAERIGGTANTAHERLKGQPKYSMIVPIGGMDYEEWLGTIHRNKRKKLRKSIREGVTTSTTRDPAMIDVLYELLVATAQRQGITHRPKQYFIDMQQAFGDDLYFSYATIEDRICSVGLCVNTSDTIYSMYNGNSPEALERNAVTQLYCEIIREGISLGARHVDFGGVFALNSSDHLYEFKIQFMPKGGEATIYAGEVEAFFTADADRGGAPSSSS